MAAELIGPEPAEALAGLLDIDVPRPVRDGVLPPLWHWVYLLERRRQSDLGEDGHPVHGVPEPPGPGWRRMFAGGRVTAYRPIRIGRLATRGSEVAGVAEKSGRSGPLTFVTVRARIEQDGALAVVDEQDIVYRPPGSRLPARTAPDGPGGDPGGDPARGVPGGGVPHGVSGGRGAGAGVPGGGVPHGVSGGRGAGAGAPGGGVPHGVSGGRGAGAGVPGGGVPHGVPGGRSAGVPGEGVPGGGFGFEVDPTVLFRFSALTYNAHRIHYDREFAVREGYPDLVVHGPLQALLMAEALRRRGVELLGRTFSYRLLAPVFGAQRLAVTASGGPPSAGASVSGVPDVDAPDVDAPDVDAPVGGPDGGATVDGASVGGATVGGPSVGGVSGASVTRAEVRDAAGRVTARSTLAG